MRLEDIVVRHLPEGGTVLDRRPEESRGQLSFSAESRIRVVSEADSPDLLLAADTQLPDPGPAAPLAVVLSEAPPAEAPLPDALAWAGSTAGQLVEVAAVLAPRCVAMVVVHGKPAQVPTQPGVASDPADDATWRRLSGELIVERFRATVLTERLEKAQEDLAAEKARGAETRRRLRALRQHRSKDTGAGRTGFPQRVARLARRRDP